MAANPTAGLDAPSRQSTDASLTVREPFTTHAIVAGAASVVAGIAHYAATADHLPEWPLAAVLFTLAGAFQIVWPVALRTGGRSRVLIAGVAVNTGVVAAWALSRSIGLPIGHHAGAPESVGALDAVAVMAELVVIVGAIRALYRSARSARASTEK
jgi:hypothetical protein